MVANDKKRKEEIKRMIEEIEAEVSKESGKSMEFKRYMKEELEARGGFSWYEKLCKGSHGYIKIDLGKKLKEEMEKDILISGLKIKPDEVSSLVITSMALFMVIFLPFMILMTSGEKFFLPIIGLGLSYYFLTYPKYKATVTKIRASDESIKVLLYILIYLKLNPDLLGAVRFTAAKCSGPIGQDLKKVVWDVETGRFTNIEDALRSYGYKWRLFDEAFVKSLEMLKGLGMIKSEERKDALLRKTLSYVLDNTYDNMRKYASSLRNPIMMIHTMGITLPIFGLVLFPLVSIFMTDEVNVPYVMIGYIVILPLLIGWYVNRTISKRPGAFTHPDVEDKEPKNRFIIKIREKRYYIPLIPLCVFLFISIAMPGIIHFANLTSNYMTIFGSNEPDFAKTLWKKFLQEQYRTENLIPNALLALTVVFGLMIATVVYFRAQSSRKEKIRLETERVESQFQLTLYELGDVLESNIPIERAIIHLIQEYEKSEKGPTEMLSFLRGVRNNMFLGNMLLENAFFDKNRGVAWLYPSSLIRDVCRIVVDSVRKGSRALAMTCKTISRFLTRQGKVENLIRALLDETMSGIRMQITFVAPFICGIVAAASSLLVQMLQQLSVMLERIEQMFQLHTTIIGTGTKSLSESLSLIRLEETIPPTILELFVGIYLIEITILLCYLLNGIEHGFDKINRDMLIARSLIKSVIAFSMMLMIVLILFAPIIYRIPALGA